MSNNALYAYGIIKFGFDLDWKETGINEKNVYMLSNGDFTALVHDCQEKPYAAEDPKKIREFIVTHNEVLDKAMENFGGVIPMPFNTIIKKGENSAQDNLKKLLNDDKDKLKKIWNKIKGKKEYGIRIYYEKNKLVQEASMSKEVKKIEKNIEGKGKGLSYLLEGKINSKTKEIVQNKINQLKQEFCDKIKKITNDIDINISRVLIDEKKDLLMSLSILGNEEEMEKIKEIVKKNRKEGFSFQWVGPFAPYSFVEDERE